MTIIDRDQLRYRGPTNDFSADRVFYLFALSRFPIFLHCRVFYLFALQRFLSICIVAFPISFPISARKKAFKRDAVTLFPPVA